MILLTGATGFVGTALVPVLVRQGFGVRAAVRTVPDGACLSPLPGPPPGGEGMIHSDARDEGESLSDFPSLERMMGSSHEGEGTTIEVAPVGSIGPDTDWGAALSGVDTVVHLAARVHVTDETAADPMAAFRQVNVLGTERLARSAAAAGVRRLVFLSSVKVNGEGTRGRAYTEGDAPAPEDGYARSKWEAERGLARIADETGLEVVVLRPPLVYGPGVKANFLALMRAIDRGLPLPLGAIDNRRSLLFVGNLADAVVRCIGHPGAAGKTFLLRDGEDVSTPELIRRLARALERPARLFPFPPALLKLAAGLAGRREAADRLLGSLTVDDSRIRRELGWAPPHGLDQGLRITAAWYRSRRPGVG